MRRETVRSYELGPHSGLTLPNPLLPQALLELAQLFLFQSDEAGQLRFNDVQLALSRAPSATVDLEPQNADLFLRALLQPATDEAMRKEGEAAHVTVTQELDAFTAAAASAVSTTTGAPAAASTVVVVISSSVEESFPVPVEAKGSLLHKVCTSHTPLRTRFLDFYLRPAPDGMTVSEAAGTRPSQVGAAPRGENGASFRVIFVNVFEHPCSEPALLYGRRCCTELSSHADACGASSVVTVAAAGPTEGADALAEQLRELMLSAVFDAAAPVPPHTLHLQFAMPLHGTTSRVACDVRPLPTPRLPCGPSTFERSLDLSHVMELRDCVSDVHEAWGEIHRLSNQVVPQKETKPCLNPKTSMCGEESQVVTPVVELSLDLTDDEPTRLDMGTGKYTHPLVPAFDAITLDHGGATNSVEQNPCHAPCGPASQQPSSGDRADVAMERESTAPIYFVEELVPLDDVNDASLFGKPHLLLAASLDDTESTNTNAQVRLHRLRACAPLCATHASYFSRVHLPTSREVSLNPNCASAAVRSALSNPGHIGPAGPLQRQPGQRAARAQLLVLLLRGV
jgi:hypothetical protein